MSKSRRKSFYSLDSEVRVGWNFWNFDKFIVKVLCVIFVCSPEFILQFYIFKLCKYIETISSEDLGHHTLIALKKMMNTGVDAIY